MGTPHVRNTSGLRPFVKGQIANPGGRPKVPEHLRKIKSISPNEVNKIIAKYARMTYKELIKDLENENHPMMERLIAKIFKESLKNGDYNALNFLLDRAIGKAQVVFDEEDGSDAEKISKMSFQELLQVIRDNIPQMKEVIDVKDVPVPEIDLLKDQMNELT